MNLVDMQVTIKGEVVKLDDIDDLEALVYDLIRLLKWPETGPFRIVKSTPPPVPRRAQAPKAQKVFRGHQPPKGHSTSDIAETVLSAYVSGLKLPLLVAKMREHGWKSDSVDPERMVSLALGNRKTKFQKSSDGTWSCIGASRISEAANTPSLIDEDDE